MQKLFINGFNVSNQIGEFISNFKVNKGSLKAQIIISV